jgi:membrane protein implicated in regulation of membrane protease activity
MMLLCLYWFLVAIGGGYFILSFIVGEIADLGESAFEGVSHSLEGVFNGVLGAPEAGDVDFIDALSADTEFDVGPSPFSCRTILMFAAGFGAGGLIGNGIGLSEPLTLIPAFGFGVFAGVMSWLVLKFLYGEQGSTTIEPSDYIGLVGRISVPVPEDRLGQVMLDVKMQKKRMPARSESGEPIAVNAQVEIVSAEGGVLIVRTFV